jgi:hypothetical protein
MGRTIASHPRSALARFDRTPLTLSKDRLILDPIESAILNLTDE